jgi:lon-related putative ATP-dependent protease
MVDAHKLLIEPFAYESLKRALLSQEIRVESLAERLSLVSTVSLEPQAIPLDIKVVLVGERIMYYLLSALDPEFSELFKVPVDFDDAMSWNEENARLYARMLASFAKSKDLRPMDPGAIGRLVEHAARVSGDSEKLTARVGKLHDLIRESDYLACEKGRQVISELDVSEAIDLQIGRADRIRERMQEEVQRGNKLIDTDGAEVGQVNGLSVLELGGFAFGMPSRITARVRLGKGNLVDIEREVELGGPIHSKGVLILSGFLGERYASEIPLCLSASLVFEQSYGGVEGDSASSAELYALLSALAGIPLSQSIAVTGSVNQHGRVQAIGGVNEKIEGFFDICRQRGLNGEQGVLIPASNVKHLMLRRDVAKAAREGLFQVYPIETIDEGIEILCGISAGQRQADGSFPDGSINRRVQDRLQDMAEKVRDFGRSVEPGSPS